MVADDEDLEAAGGGVASGAAAAGGAASGAAAAGAAASAGTPMVLAFSSSTGAASTGGEASAGGASSFSQNIVTKAPGGVNSPCLGCLHVGGELSDRLLGNSLLGHS